MSIEAMKIEGPLHVVCQCDKCKAEKQEPVMRIDWWPSAYTERYIANMVAWEHLPIGTLLYTTPQPQQDAWKNVAIRLGEELSSVGPDGYYDMTAEQWLDWAMNQQPRGKNSLPQPQREWVGLTKEQETHLAHGFLMSDDDTRNDGRTVYRIIQETQRLLKEANT